MKKLLSIRLTQREISQIYSSLHNDKQIAIFNRAKKETQLVMDKFEPLLDEDSRRKVKKSRLAYTRLKRQRFL